ncbi:polysaccharide lyase family 1 modular protein [Striga asiatica]|uniref:Polysaccharide lyase family 1 modular protein n=1 Tax=Striga asiatica TaxID=4170 RepID=A0A5A7R0D4_STRAF|nr:polysaccharide lyase family 1 modular protein [Striga asiatica]
MVSLSPPVQQIPNKIAEVLLLTLQHLNSSPSRCVLNSQQLQFFAQVGVRWVGVGRVFGARLLLRGWGLLSYRRSLRSIGKNGVLHLYVGSDGKINERGVRQG